MNNHQSKSFTKRTQMILQQVEDAILVGLLLLMIGMAVTQIFLRNLFGAGIVWSDVMVRILVLWVGLIGAMVASRQDNHIAIDVLDRYLPECAKIYTNFMARLFTALVCMIVAYYSLLFVQMEFADGGMAFAWVPTWLCEAIIPFAFTVIALRYFLLSFVNLKKVFKSRS
ncbi:MAG: TRAP transporter small permease [Desulfobacterales bacterium]|jgi:TRAP-type C4-dicarboxylate transport system permease small subunit